MSSLDIRDKGILFATMCIETIRENIGQAEGGDFIARQPLYILEKNQILKALLDIIPLSKMTSLELGQPPELLTITPVHIGNVYIKLPTEEDSEVSTFKCEVRMDLDGTETAKVVESAPILVTTFEYIPNPNDKNNELSLENVPNSPFLTHEMKFCDVGEIITGKDTLHKFQIIWNLYKTTNGDREGLPFTIVIDYMKDTTSNKWYGDFKWIAIEKSRSFSEPKDFTDRLMSYFMKFFESNLQGIYIFFGPDPINT